jgi:hypothetical protein
MKRKRRRTATVPVETTRAREIVALAQRKIAESDVAGFVRTLSRIAGHTRSTTYRSYPDTRDEALSVQREIKNGLVSVMTDDDWNGLSIRPVLDATGIRWEGPMRNVLILTVMQWLAPGNGAPRLARCIAEGCNTIIVKRKKAAYCSVHGTPVARNARSRAHWAAIEAKRTRMVDGLPPHARRR